MPDITMCDGKGCDAKDKCYRYTAEANPYGQAYFDPAPIDGADCDYFTDNKNA